MLERTLPETITAVTATATVLDTVRPHRRQKLQEMRRIRARYDAGEINRNEYVRAMAFKNLPVVLVA
ncbi:hypothetical protein ACOMHN_053901 [Nucella lapillus]